MKKKLTLTIFLIFTLFNCFSQNNQNVINYNISFSSRIIEYPERTVIGIGGDLELSGENLCIPKNNGVQKLFESATSSSISIDINNRGGGNCCVSLIIETTIGKVITVIPEDTQSGILKFTRIKKAYLTFTQNPRDRTEQIPTAKGIATIWF